MQPVLLDSSIYISALREGEQALLALRQLAPKEPLWLSSVVLEELYAGVNARDRRVVERLERDFESCTAPAACRISPTTGIVLTNVSAPLFTLSHIEGGAAGSCGGVCELIVPCFCARAS